jgi:hypothetical protein
MADLSRVRGAKYPKIVKRLDLGEYHEDLKGDYLEIWVNWSRDYNNRVGDSRSNLLAIADMPDGTDEEKAAKTKAHEAWLAESWELHAEFWGCTPEEVQAVYEVDVDLWRWARSSILYSAGRSSRPGMWARSQR